MATGHNSNTDLYCYDGYEKITPPLQTNSEVLQPRHDSGVGFETMADAIHHEAVGTLFASQIVAEVPFQIATYNLRPECTQHGPKSSIFARYDARSEQRGKVNPTISELRQWLENFTLPQEARTSDQERVNHETPYRVLRKRSLSTQAAKVVASRFPQCGPADGHIDRIEHESIVHRPEDEDVNKSTVDKQLTLPLSTALPLSPLKRPCEWMEEQCAQAEYNSIEQAHANRLEAEKRSAQDRERKLKVEISNWENAEKHRKCAENNWPNHSLEASVIRELDYGEELTAQMSHMINNIDSRLYIVPRIWDFADLPRRTRLYSNPHYFLRYVMRERKVAYLLEARYEDLKGGRSKQPEVVIAEELQTLSSAMEDRCNAEEDDLSLLLDFLKWAVAHTALEFKDMTSGGRRKSTRSSALTNDIPLSVLEDVIEVNPELLVRFEHLRDLEQTYFPERYILNSLPPMPSTSPTQPQFTPRGRQIPMRQPERLHNSSTNDGTDPDKVKSSARLTRTLPRFFKPCNALLLRVSQFDPHPVPTLDRKMVGEPTSPMKPPESNYFRPPRPKRKLPLRMLDYPNKIEEYTPEPLPSFTLSNSTTTRVRRSSRTSPGVSERTLRRSNPPRKFLTLERVKRARALREPLTPENIDKVVERSWRKDLEDLHRRRSLAEYTTVQKYWRVMRQFSSQASTYWVDATHVGRGYGYDKDNVHAEDREGRLHLVIPLPSESDPSETNPSEDVQDFLDADDFIRAEGQKVFDTLEVQDSVVRIEDTTASMHDSAVRVIDFALRENTNRTRDNDSIRSIQFIEDLEDSLTDEPSAIARTKAGRWPSCAPQEYDSELESTVTENEHAGAEMDLLETVPADKAGLFQRPLSRLENRIETGSDANIEDVESSDSKHDTSHDSLQQIEPKGSVADGIDEVQDPSGAQVGSTFTDIEGTLHRAEPVTFSGITLSAVYDPSDDDAGIANTESTRSGSAIEPNLASAQLGDPVERPSSRVQQIVERQTEMTPEEIDSYDTEEED